MDKIADDRSFTRIFDLSSCVYGQNIRDFVQELIKIIYTQPNKSVDI